MFKIFIFSGGCLTVQREFDGYMFIKKLSIFIISMFLRMRQNRVIVFGFNVKPCFFMCAMRLCIYQNSEIVVSHLMIDVQILYIKAIDGI